MRRLFCAFYFISFLTNWAFAAEFTRENLLSELTGKSVQNLGEIDLYAELVSSYQNNKATQFKSYLEIFIRKYPKSSFADNALYLAGRMDLENRNYAQALKYLQTIQTKYPQSNKAVSARFLKALAYKKMNLSAEARRVLREVIVKYPGSPESFRADNELKLLN